MVWNYRMQPNGVPLKIANPSYWRTLGFRPHNSCPECPALYPRSASQVSVTPLYTTHHTLSHTQLYHSETAWADM